jgi:hypothetical protein
LTGILIYIFNQNFCPLKLKATVKMNTEIKNLGSIIVFDVCQFFVTPRQIQKWEYKDILTGIFQPFNSKFRDDEVREYGKFLTDIFWLLKI